MRLGDVFFHFKQSIIRNIDKQGIKKKYQNDEEFRNKVKLLSALSFIPENEVNEKFNLVCEQFDMYDEESITAFLQYFSTTYVRGAELAGRNRPPLFPIQIWNQFQAAKDKASKTTALRAIITPSTACSQVVIQLFGPYFLGLGVMWLCMSMKLIVS